MSPNFANSLRPLAMAICLTACGHSPSASLSTPAASAAATVGGFSGKTFEAVTYKTPRSGQTYTASLLKDGCAGPHLGFQVDVVDYDPSEHFTACYNLDNGSLKAASAPLDRAGYNDPRRKAYDETLALPVDGAHYFAYVDRLTQVLFSAQILGKVDLADYLTATIAELKSSQGVDAVILRRYDRSEDRRSITLSVQVKAGQDRSLLVKFGDDMQRYDLQEMPISKASDFLTITVTKPEALDYRDGAAVQLYVVPRGGTEADASAKIAEVFPYLCQETVRVWPLSSASTLHRGQKNQVAVLWSVDKPRTVLVRLSNPSGQVVAEAAVDVQGSEQSSRQPGNRSAVVDLDLGASLPLDDHYTVEARLVPEHGQWSDKITSYSRVGSVRVRP